MLTCLLVYKKKKKWGDLRNLMTPMSRSEALNALICYNNRLRLAAQPQAYLGHAGERRMHSAVRIDREVYSQMTDEQLIELADAVAGAGEE